MENIYSALLLHAAGQAISEEGIKKVLKAASAKVDDGQVKVLVAGLEGQDINTLIQSALAAPVAAAAPAAAEAAKPAEEPAKKTQKKAEPAAEPAGLGSLFG
jgi:large subunit ribosomal protein L12